MLFRSLQLLDQARLLNLVGRLRQALVSGYRDTPLPPADNERLVAADPDAITPAISDAATLPARVARKRKATDKQKF